MREFLSSYYIPKDIVLGQAVWKQFFTEVVRCSKGASSHSYLATFLVSVGQKYHENGRAADFIIDLLNLDVGNLFSSESLICSY